MNRNIILVTIAIVLVCAICAVVGGMFFLAQQMQQPPVARAAPTARVGPTSEPCPQTILPAKPTPTASAAGPVETGTPGAIKVTANQLTNNFPDKFVFQLDAQSSAQITQILLVMQFEGGTLGSRPVTDLTPDSKVSIQYEWRMSQTYLPPGVTGEYAWIIQDDAGNRLQTSKQPFRVEDPRRKWNKLENEKLALYWYAGGASFGKALFDRGVRAISQLEKDTCVIVDNQIQVFVYGDRKDFLDALGPRATGKEGGVTFSEFANGIVLMNVEVSQLDWGRGTTAHELTHVIMRQKIHSPLGEASFPLWLNEGLAVYYETNAGSLDSQFAMPLKRAIQTDTLYPLSQLSGYFNSTWEAGNLAYGESYSVVEFIFRHYGSARMAQLLQEIKNGGTYDDTFKKALGVDTDGLEDVWRKDVGAKPRASVTRTPVIAPTAFPTFSLSTDATPTPRR